MDQQPADLQDYPDYVDALRADAPALAEELTPFRGVSDVLDWLQERDLGRNSIDIVGQDEFEYDLLIQLGLGERWLVFGVT